MRRVPARPGLRGRAGGWLCFVIGCVVTGGALPAAAAQFACTEQGIRDAISAGGGPHTFACSGPTVVTTGSTITIDNGVVLDGQDDLTVDGNDAHLVFQVALGVTAELRSLTVSGGHGFSGGGIRNDGTLHMLDCTVSENTATSAGGGIFNGLQGTLTLTNTTVSDNSSLSTSSTYGGGGIYYRASSGSPGSVTLTGSTVTRNSAQIRGGGIMSYYGTVSLIDSVVSDNQLLDSFSALGTEGGGGIRNEYGTLTVTNTAIVRNSADEGTGGGISAFGSPATITITDSTISDNAGSYFGGAWGGGGIWNSGANVTLTNTTLSGNQGFTTGGDAILNASGTTLLSSCTVAANSAPGGGQITGAILRTAGSVTLHNTVVANPSTINCVGGVTTQGGNVESPGDTCGLTDASDQVNVTASALALGPLANNDGFTQTHALGPGSVAIDAAVDCPPPDTDQRGVARPQLDACDSGAYELRAAEVPALSPGGLLLLAGLLGIAGAISMRRPEAA